MFNMGDKKPTIEGTQFLIVGIPGSGKSSALASFATEKNPMYVFDCDARLDGILASTWLKPHYKYIDADIYETRLGFKAVRAKFLEFYNLHQAGKLKYKNIVVDSVSSLSQMFLQDAQFQKANKPTPQSAQSAAKQLGFEEAKFETIDEYKYVLKCFHILFYDFFKSFPGVNLFLSCWTADQWGKSPNDPYGPDIKLPGRKLFAQGNVVNELPGYFSEVWEFHKEDPIGMGGKTRYNVTFDSALAKTSIPQLRACRKLDTYELNFKAELDKLMSKSEEQILEEKKKPSAQSK